jgi:hypothetical protein
VQSDKFSPAKKLLDGQQKYIPNTLHGFVLLRQFSDVNWLTVRYTKFFSKVLRAFAGFMGLESVLLAIAASIFERISQAIDAYLYSINTLYGRPHMHSASGLLAAVRQSSVIL